MGAFYVDSPWRKIDIFRRHINKFSEIFTKVENKVASKMSGKASSESLDTDKQPEMSEIPRDKRSDELLKILTSPLPTDEQKARQLNADLWQKIKDLIELMNEPWEGAQTLRQRRATEEQANKKKLLLLA